MKTLVLLGGGGHCRACIDVIELAGDYRIVGILDRPELQGSSVLGYPVIGGDDAIAALQHEGHQFLVSVGQVRDVAPRRRLFERLCTLQAPLATVVSPRAYVSRHAQIGAGTLVLHDALVNANASIGRNCIINSKALVEHDARVEDHCHIATGAIVNGGVHVKTGTFFGSGATSQEGASSAEFDFIKAGTVLRRHD